MIPIMIMLSTSYEQDAKLQEEKLTPVVEEDAIYIQEVKKLDDEDTTPTKEELKEEYGDVVGDLETENEAEVDMIDIKHTQVGS